jgi:tRNA U55 pseudouridine synthase TruB
VARAARDVEIHSLRALAFESERARLVVDCSSGTYIRTLCEEIGRRLGVPAHMDMLVRTAAGPFTLAQACAEADLLAAPFAHLIDPLDVLPQPRVALQAEDVVRFCHGNAVIGGVEKTTGEVLVTLDGRMIGTGLASVTPDGAVLQPTRVFVQPG